MQISRDYIFNCSEKITNLGDDGYNYEGQQNLSIDELKIK
jgi:hypothetical protein